MPNFNYGAGFRSNPMDAFNEMSGMVKQSRLAKMLGGYYQNGQADLGQIAEIDPQAAQTIQAQQKQSGLAALLGEAYNAPEDQRQGILAKVMGMDPEVGMRAVKTFDPRFAQASAANGVQSTFVNDKGERVAIMRDGSVQVLGANAPNNQIIDTGNGYYGVNKGNLSAAPVQVGGQQQPSIAPPPSMAGGEMFAGLGNIPGVQVTSGLRTPERNAKVGGVANSYHLTDQARDILPPKTPEEAAQVRQFAAQNGLEIIDEGDHWHMEPRGQQAQGGQQLRKAPPEMTPYQQAQLSLSQQAAQRAGNADQRAQAEFERKATTSAGQKPMPVGALKADLEIEEAIGASEQVFSIAAKHLERMGNGSLVIGTPEAIAAKFRTITNNTTENDRNLTELNADKTAIVNASLRLNKGVQTEGDAQRAVNELMSANDHKTTLAAMKRLVEINKRAVALQERRRALLRQNYGGGQQQQAPAANGGFRILPD